MIAGVEGGSEVNKDYFVPLLDKLDKIQHLTSTEFALLGDQVPCAPILFKIKRSYNLKEAPSKNNGWQLFGSFYGFSGL